MGRNKVALQSRPDAEKLPKAEARRIRSIVAAHSREWLGPVADVTTPVLASVLAQLLGRSGGRIACLGFGDGIAAATLGRTAGLTIAGIPPNGLVKAFIPDGSERL